MNPADVYKITEVALSYAALCSGLAGFVFAAFVILIPNGFRRQEQLVPYQRRLLALLAQLLPLNALGLFLAAVLQTMRSGLDNSTPQALIATFLADAVMVLHMLLVLGNMLIIAFLLPEVHPMERKSLRLLFDITAILALLLMYATANNMWKPLSHLTTIAAIILHVTTIALPVTVFLLARKLRVSFEVFFKTVLLTTGGIVVVVAFVWMNRQSSLSFVHTLLVYVASGPILALVGLTLGWMRYHLLIFIPPSTAIYHSSLSQK